MSSLNNETAVTGATIEIRECTTIDEFEQCITLQRDVFGFPDIEVSPRRHFIVSRKSGGWVLGAFVKDELIGFVHQMAAVNDTKIFGYSHMLAVNRSFQNEGVGARLKWAQRERALGEGRSLIRWTWEPLQARNAHFNLNRLGVVVRSYGLNFYGTDYSVPRDQRDSAPGIDSDRLFAEWELGSDRVQKLANGSALDPIRTPAATIEIPVNWYALIKDDPTGARREQLRVRSEFEQAFADGLICAGFIRDTSNPRYLLYDERQVKGDK
jgi:predicted GNAT superfamily acetyltransferase